MALSRTERNSVKMRELMVELGTSKAGLNGSLHNTVGIPISGCVLFHSTLFPVRRTVKVHVCAMMFFILVFSSHTLILQPVSI